MSRYLQTQWLINKIWYHVWCAFNMLQILSSQYFVYFALNLMNLIENMWNSESIFNRISFIIYYSSSHKDISENYYPTLMYDVYSVHHFEACTKAGSCMPSRSMSYSKNELAFTIWQWHLMNTLFQIEKHDDDEHLIRGEISLFMHETHTQFSLQRFT